LVKRNGQKTHLIIRIKSKVVFLHFEPAGRPASGLPGLFCLSSVGSLVCSVIDLDEFNPDGFYPDTTLQIIWISASDTDLDQIISANFRIYPNPDSNPHPFLVSAAECESFYTAGLSIHRLKRKYNFPHL
jgi:hypothetical protein